MVEFVTETTQTVSVRANWGDAWVAVPHLYCRWLENTASPGIDSAEFEWRYGRGIQPGENTVADYTRQNLNRYYVRVYLPKQNAYWFGIFADDFDDRDGAYPNSGTAKQPGGRQALMAFGLELILQRSVIDKSIVRGTTTEQAAGDFEKQIERAIPFNFGNGGGGEVQRGNATPAINGGDIGALGTKIFSNDFTAGQAVEWSTKNILDYLLAYFPPTSPAGVPEIPFYLLGQTSALEFDFPQLDVAGMTLFDVLNRLVDRRRLLGWKIELNDTTTPESVQIFVFTYAAANITLPSTDVFPANSEQTTAVFDNSVTVNRCVVGRRAANVYDQVIARGARRTSCFTLAASAGNLVADWTSDQQTAYRTAASGETGYGALDDGDKMRRNDAAREADQLQRVYSHFRIPTAWNGKVYDAASNPFYAFPPLDAAGNIDTLIGEDFAQNYVRLLPRLPLDVGKTYRNNEIESQNGGDETPAGSIAEPLPAFAVLKLIDGRYAYCDKLGADLTFGFGFRVQDDTPGIVLRCNQNGFQHALASADFSAVDATDEAAVLNWRDDLLTTVYAEADSYAEAQLPATADLAATDAVRRLIIDIPDARLDYIVAGTVVDVAADGTLNRSDGGFVRDDRPRLKNIARIAHDWYTSARNTLAVELAGIVTAYDAGVLITTIDGGATLETINTVVTRLRLDFANGTTNFETENAELDLPALL